MKKPGLVEEHQSRGLQLTYGGGFAFLMTTKAKRREKQEMQTRRRMKLVRTRRAEIGFRSRGAAADRALGGAGPRAPRWAGLKERTVVM